MSSHRTQTPWGWEGAWRCSRPTPSPALCAALTMSCMATAGEKHRKQQEKEPGFSQTVSQSSNLSETILHNHSKISTRLSKKVQSSSKIQCTVKNPEEAARSPLPPHLPSRLKHIALTLDFGTATSKTGGQSP